MDLSTRKVIISHHVLFDEHMFPLTLQLPVTKPQPSLPAQDLGESTLDLVPIRVYARELHPPWDPTTDRTGRVSLLPAFDGCVTRRSPMPTVHALAHDSCPDPTVVIHGGSSGSPTRIPTVLPSFATCSQSIPAVSTSPDTVTKPRSNSSSTSTQRHFKHPVQAPQDYMHTRSKSGIVVPKKHFNLSGTIDVSPIPTNYRIALKDPQLV
jgi:hypothetical protein